MAKRFALYLKVVSTGLSIVLNVRRENRRGEVGRARGRERERERERKRERERLTRWSHIILIQ
jgi:hypothetical protein